MADICMCSGVACPLKENCYRFLCQPGEFLQSYFLSVPYDHQKKECAHYWPNKTDSKQITDLNKS